MHCMGLCPFLINNIELLIYGHLHSDADAASAAAAAIIISHFRSANIRLWDRYLFYFIALRKWEYTDRIELKLFYRKWHLHYEKHHFPCIKNQKTSSFSNSDFELSKRFQSTYVRDRKIWISCARNLGKRRTTFQANRGIKSCHTLWNFAINHWLNVKHTYCTIESNHNSHMKNP